jgi:hypothetical protein
MPHTIATLVSSRNLSETDVTATLTAAGLSLDKGEYSDEDIKNKFDIIRDMFDKGEVNDYQLAQALFESVTTVKSAKNRPVKPVEPAKGRRSQKNQSVNSSPANSASLPLQPIQESKQDNNTLNSDNQVHSSNTVGAKEETLSVTDLIHRVKQHLDLTLTLKQVVTILEASNLPDKEYYSQAEANRFLVACSVILQGGNSDITSQIQDTTLALETGLIGLLNQVTSERAKEVPDLIKQLYIQNVVISLAQEQEDIESFFLQLKNSIVAGIEGKSPLKSIMEIEWIQTPLLESQNLPSHLPAKSDNGTNSELKSE